MRLAQAPPWRLGTRGPGGSQWRRQVSLRSTSVAKGMMQQGFRSGRRICLRLALALLAVAGAILAPARAEPKLLEERSSTYNNIYVYKEGANVIMTFEHNRRLYK